MLAGLLLCLAPFSARAATVAPESIASDATWTPDRSPYLVYTDLSIAAGATLTIEPGVVVKLDPQGAFDISGALVAGSASSSEEVVFADIADASYGGDTAALAATSAPSVFNVNTIVVEPGARLSLAHARLRYDGVALPEGSGGDTLFFPPMIQSRGELFISESILEHGLAGGVLSGWFGEDTASTTIEGTTIGASQKGGRGVDLAGGTLRLAEDTIAEASSVEGGLLLAGPESAPLALEWDASDLADTQVFPPPPYANEIEEYIAVDEGTSVSAAPGATLAFGPHGGLDISGAFSAQGNAEAPVTLAPSAQAQAAGWPGIAIESGGTLSLAHAALDHGGEEWDRSLCADDSVDASPCSSALFNAGGTLSISDTSFSGSIGRDVLEEEGASDLERVHLPAGARVASGELTIHESDIGAAGAFGIENDGSATTSAEDDYWGDPSGPAEPAGNPEGAGASVSGAVSYAPWLSADPFLAPPPGHSSVLFIPGTEASRLYMKLSSNTEKRVWEPASDADLKYLAINLDGSSANNLYTKDIIDSIWSQDPGIIARLVKAIAPGDLEVYGGLEQFLDGLVASSTIKEWRAYPYDWRYDPLDVVKNGTLTEEPDGSIARVYLADVVAQMASSSPTGKVTIIAHSNGGLLAKALTQELGPSAADYIDRIILVGTPQFGTPAAVGSLLHGDGQSIGLGFGLDLVSAKAVRAEAEVIPDAYALLPSPAYFTHVATPVVEFSDNALLKPFVDAYGSAISAFGAFESFIDDGKGIDEQFDNSTLKAPLPLPVSAIQKAEEGHQALDSWQPPAGIAVSAIAGWGSLTPATLDYTKAAFNILSCGRSDPLNPAHCELKPILQHTEKKTEDGDGTVVSPSALGDIADAWYFNLKKYGTDFHQNFSHQDLTSAQPIQETLSDLIKGQPISNFYLTSLKPSTKKDPLVIISSHSPVNIIATDASGNETGVVPAAGTGLALTVAHIPESAVDLESGEEYLTLPQEGSYSVAAAGYAQGPTTLEVEEVDAEGAVQSEESFAAIPTTASTTMAFSIEGGAASEPQVDIDGDGVIDLEVASDTPAALAPADALSLLRQEVAALSARPGVKNRLLAQIEKLAGEAGELASAQADVSWLETLIGAQAGVKLSEDQAASMLGLIQYLKL